MWIFKCMQSTFAFSALILNARTSRCDGRKPGRRTGGHRLGNARRAPPTPDRAQPMSVAEHCSTQTYEEIGSGYTPARRADPRIAEQIHAALCNATSVVNVGAGAGAYE